MSGPKTADRRLDRGSRKGPDRVCIEEVQREWADAGPPIPLPDQQAAAPIHQRSLAEIRREISKRRKEAPQGWTYNSFAQCWINGSRLVYGPLERGGFFISEDDIWLPGNFDTLQSAIDGFNQEEPPRPKTRRLTRPSS